MILITIKPLIITLTWLHHGRPYPCALFLGHFLVRVPNSFRHIKLRPPAHGTPYAAEACLSYGGAQTGKHEAVGTGHDGGDL